MNRGWTKMLLTISLLLATSPLLACTTESIEVPGTLDISVPYPQGVEEVYVILEIDSAHLEADGKGSKLIEGSIEYNIASLHPKMTIKQDRVKIMQRRGIQSTSGGTIENNWKLHFGRDMPFALEIQAGGYSGDWDLGGLPITDLEIAQGTSNTTLNFSQPNPGIMRCMDIHSGAARLNLLNLANANLEKLDFSGGASDYLVDFNGDLRRDIDVSVTMTAGNLTLVIPPGTAAEITWEGSFGASINTDSNFSKQRSDKKRGDLYVNQAWLDGTKPKLDIKITVTGSSINVRSELPPEN